MSKCILVIDDEEALRELTCSCLEDLGGWDVVMAESGREGLIVAEAHALDAILLDMSMPEMDGFQFYEKLKENPKTQSIPIILLTAKVLPDDLARFSTMDIAGVITKPFDPRIICGQIATMLNWDGQDL